MEIVLASQNQGKLDELKKILSNYNVEVFLASDLNVDVNEVIEDGDSFYENALRKASYVYDKVGKPVLSDDSGLVLEKFPKLLSVHTARFRNDLSYPMRHKLILDMYKNIENRRAYFQTDLIFYDGTISHYQGVVNGQISLEIKGGEGFGYDPIFIPDGDYRTFGEMNMDEKEQYSHRAKALKKFIMDKLEEAK